MAEMEEIVSYNRVGFSGRNNHKISIPGTTFPGSDFIKIVNVIKFQDTCNKLLSWTRYRYIYYVDYVYLIDNVVRVSLNMFNNGSSSGVKYLLMIR
jgi:hypothetical protein